MSVRLTPYLASAKQTLTLKIKNKTKKYEVVFSIGHKIPIFSKYSFEIIFSRNKIWETRDTQATILQEL